MTLLTVLVLGLFFAMGCLMLVALRILVAQRNGLSTENHLRAAKALGLTMPPSFLARADHLLE
jgi:hypothetical protein